MNRHSPQKPFWKSPKRLLLWAVLAAFLIQFVPYGHAHTNPPVSGEPHWDSPQTAALVRRACYDCHSNETTWPWYSHVAPVSWLVQSDVGGARGRLNFTEWNRPQHDVNHIAAVVRSGHMPPWFFLPMHPEAHLTAGDRQALIAGAAKTFGPQVPRGERH